MKVLETIAAAVLMLVVALVLFPVAYLYRLVRR